MNGLEVGRRILGVTLFTTTLAGCEVLEQQLAGNQAPAISELVAEPSEGEAPLLVGFSWQLVDVEGDTLSCTLTTGDGAEQVLENYAQVSNAFHTFETGGGYTTVLRVSDGTNQTAKSVPIRVLEPEQDE